MRAAPSPPEQLLWAALTNRKLGVSFRRQVPLAGYICEFVCASRRLVVEVDGAQHHHRQSADARRAECLRRLGYRVLRIEARLVVRQIAAAVALVQAALAGLASCFGLRRTTTPDAAWIHACSLKFFVEVNSLRA
jgi:very-short-patch-repair endonuclease